MNNQSDLQQKYPLSPKKYWKKIISNVIGYAFASIFIGGFTGVLISIASSGGDVGSNYTIFISAVVGIVVLFIVSMSIYSLYVKVYIKRYYYAGEEHFITIKKGVFAPSEIHVQWQKIQDVYVDQDILDRIMGLYDVHIASATSASSIEAHIDGVDYAASEGLKKFFLDKVSGRGHTEKNDGSQTAASHSSGAPEKVSKTIKLNEDISSDKYPLSNKWIGVSLVNKFISSFIISFFVLFVILGKAKNISFENAFVYIVLGWLILGVAIMIFRTIALFLWKKNYSFKFTPEHIYYREGVISLSEKHMPYSSIQDVTVKQGIIERLFGLARVFIENAAQQQVAIGRNGRPEAVFSGVILQGLSISDAKKITDILKTTVLGKDSSHYGL